MNDGASAWSFLYVGFFPTTSRSAPAALSIALLTSCDFGKPELPVMNAFPLRRATNAPVLTVGQKIRPVYSIGVTVARVVR